ncbi:MAG: P-loop NTPase, partial [Candidatus Bathyarchaeia archaeon]
PPGTGDEPLSVMQLIPGLDGAIIVTTPQSVALLDSRKAVSMAKKLDIPVLGIVENMSGYTCPKCGDRVHIFGKGGGERAAKELKISFLGSLPIDVRIREEADRGRPFIVAHPDSEAAKSFMESVDKIEAQLKRV